MYIYSTEHARRGHPGDNTTQVMRSGRNIEILKSQHAHQCSIQNPTTIELTIELIQIAASTGAHYQSWGVFREAQLPQQQQQQVEILKSQLAARLTKENDYSADF